MAWKPAVLVLLSLVAIIGLFMTPPIAQDPGYHAFADERTWLGIPNFVNVATNLPFLFIGALGLRRLSRLSTSELRGHFIVFCAGVGLVALGSAWYHLAPSTPALVFDRLPMTVAFMALFSAVISDRMSAPFGRRSLWPLVAIGIASIAWWHWTELGGAGDLRPYALVQFLPLLLMPLILLLYGKGALQAKWLWAGFAAYVGAKIAEYFDAAILDGLQVISGHGIKHLLAALSAWWILRAFQEGTVRLFLAKKGDSP